MAFVESLDSITSSVPAPKLFNVVVLEAIDLVPKVAPQAIKSIELLRGHGGPGSIRQLNFAEGIPGKFVQVKIDALDKDELTYAESVIEGGELSQFADKVESITNELKIESSPEGGSIMKTTTKYYTKPGATITEEELAPGKQMATGVLKALESYASSNPHA